VDWEQIEFTSTSVNIVESPALAQIRLVATDLNGAALPGDRVQAGSDFLVSALVKDVRQPPDPAYPGLTAADLGVFSAYLDIFYPQAAVRPVASATSPFGYVIAFNTALFGGGQKAEFIPTSGIVNEVGAYQGTSAVNFSNEQLLFSIRFTALTPPSGSASVVFQADPADAQPVNEVTLIKPNPGISVPTAQVTYLNSQMITIVGAAGEGEFTNPANPMDVNGDGFASPMDVLIVINYLNSFGTTDLRTSSAQGEGEGAARYYYDVNGDKVISPADALGVINHLNSLARGAAGEGEFAVPSVPSEAAFLALDVQTALPVSENSGASADSSRGSIYPPNEVGELSNEAALAAGLDAAMAAEESLVDELAKDVALSWLTESVDEEFFAELA
jgi:hypothetical protein